MKIRGREKQKRRKTDFKETECCPFAVVQRAALRKNDWSRGAPMVTGILGKANILFDPMETGCGPHHHIVAAVDWCRSCSIGHFNFVLHGAYKAHGPFQKFFMDLSDRNPRYSFAVDKFY